MTEQVDKNTTPAAKVEMQAQDLIAEEVEVKPSQPTDHESMKQLSTNSASENQTSRSQGRRQRRITANIRGSRKGRGAFVPRQLYADADVPRVTYEERYGSMARSRAYLKRALCLYSDRAQIFFERNYEQVNQSLVVCTLVIEAVGGLTFAGQIAEQIEQRFAALENEMMTAIDELKRIANEKGIPENLQVPAYDHKRNYVPPLHTPQSSQFMTLVSLFDRLIARVEGAWINKALGSQTRKTLISSWERKLIVFVRSLQRLRIDAIRGARQAGFGARASAIDTQVRNESKQELISTDIQTNDSDNTPEKSAPDCAA